MIKHECNDLRSLKSNLLKFDNNTAIPLDPPVMKIMPTQNLTGRPQKVVTTDDEHIKCDDISQTMCK